MRILVRLLVAAAFVVVVPPAAASAQTCPRPPAGDLAAARPAVLCLVNAERTHRGLEPLREAPKLRAAARRFAHQMVQRQVFSHDRRGMVRRIRRTGYLRHARHWSVGENIAWGGGPSAAPAAIVRAWMASPPHRRNILDRRFRHLGIGVAGGAPVDGSGGATYVTDFGVRRP